MHSRPGLAAALALCAACTRPVSPAADANVVTVTATEYAFGAPDTIPAGLTTLRMTNNGKEPHQAGLVRIDSRKTLAEVQRALMSPGAPPAWAVFVGGPDVVVPGDTANSTQALSPGTYVLICFFPSPDGKMHLEKGMIRPLVVKGPARAAVEPGGDVVLTMTDYGFALSRPLTAGTHAIRVENAGPQLHEVMVLALAPGKSAQDLVAWAAHDMKGPAPARPIGGIVGLTRGAHATFTVTLAPGRYAFACFVPDAADGKPHVAHGMLQPITVSLGGQGGT
jgi:uncharacterized cupredoxin-like copper-binding protein